MVFLNVHFENADSKIGGNKELVVFLRGGKKMKKHLSFTIIVLSAFLVTLKPTAWSSSYFNNFEGTVGSEWSSSTTNTTPIGSRRFLGQFGNKTVTLNLTGLSDHSLVQLSFDLFVIRSWDGNDTAYYAGQYMGPDKWSVGVQNGPTLLYTTFSNSTGNTPNDYQAYPDSYPGGVHPGYTGAAEINTLGYTNPLDIHWRQDSVYNLSFSFPHTASSLILDFSAFNLQAISDESWGLDNVSVTLIPEPGMLTLIGLGGLLLRQKK